MIEISVWRVEFFLLVAELTKSSSLDAGTASTGAVSATFRAISEFIRSVVIGSDVHRTLRIKDKKEVVFHFVSTTDHRS